MNLTVLLETGLVGFALHKGTTHFLQRGVRAATKIEFWPPFWAKKHISHGPQEGDRSFEHGMPWLCLTRAQGLSFPVSGWDWGVEPRVLELKGEIAT